MQIRPRVPATSPADVPRAQQPASAQAPARAAAPPALEADRLMLPRLAADNTRVVTPRLDLGLESLTKTAPADWGNVSIADRQAALRALQTLARDLKAQGRPGVEIWSKLTQAAVDQYADKQLDPRRKSDFVMQDLAVSVIGADALKHLKSYEGLPWVRKPDPLVKTFFQDWKALGIPPADNNWEAVGWAGGELDQHASADFRPQIADGTQNQIFHTLFYQFMGYTTQAPQTIRGGSIVHEVRDNGTSSEDHNAAYVGMHTGMTLRNLRDGADPAGALQDWSGMTRAAYGKGGGPEMKAGTASLRARQIDAAVQRQLGDKSLLWKGENALIDAVKWARETWGSNPDYRPE